MPPPTPRVRRGRGRRLDHVVVVVHAIVSLCLAAAAVVVTAPSSPSSSSFALVAFRHPPPSRTTRCSVVRAPTSAAAGGGGDDADANRFDGGTVLDRIARALGLDAPTKSRPSTDRGSGRDPGGGTRGRVIRTAVRPFQEGGGSIPSSASYTTRKTSMPAIIVSEAGAVGDYNHYRTSALRSTPDRAISILTGDVGSYVRSLDGGYFADDGVWNDDSDDGGDDGRRGYRDGDLGENVLVDGVDFDYFEVGMRYRFSSSTSSLNGGDGDATTTATTISEKGVVVEITEPMEPCANLCKLPYVNDPSLEPRHRVARCQYFIEALGQREGLRGWYAKVVRGGVVRVGDSLSVAVAPA